MAGPTLHRRGRAAVERIARLVLVIDDLAAGDAASDPEPFYTIPVHAISEALTAAYLAGAYDQQETALTHPAITHTPSAAAEAVAITNVLSGYIGARPASRDFIASCPNWAALARGELDRRAAEFLGLLSPAELHAIATGHIDLAALARSVE